MDFGDALKVLKSGQRVSRPSWDSNKAYVCMYKEESSGMDLLGWGSDHHPMQVYAPSIPDLLAEDWEAI